MWAGLKKQSKTVHLSAARGYLRASPDFSVGGILNKLIFKTYHCFGHVFNHMIFFFLILTVQ